MLAAAVLEAGLDHREDSFGTSDVILVVVVVVVPW
jgi:hypothetical protein